MENLTMKQFLIALLLTTIACLHAQQQPADEPTRILAYNVEIGFNNASRLLETAEWIRSYDPEVILFQEIARQDSKGFAEMARLWGIPTRLSPSRSRTIPSR